MSYFISSALQEKQIQINESNFLEAMSKRWPEAKVNPIIDKDSPYSYEWTFPYLEVYLEVSLFKDGGAVNIDGAWEPCFIFALWFRTQIPEEQQLLFYDEGFNSLCEITMNTTKEDIMNMTAEDVKEAIKSFKLSSA